MKSSVAKAIWTDRWNQGDDFGRVIKQGPKGPWRESNYKRRIQDCGEVV